jgi:hypothetical protein
MMTRKDYVKTAEILNKYRSFVDDTVWNDLIDDFAFWFENDNPNFNTDRFIEACYAKEN